MMQSCASAAKLRSGGPILPFGMKAKGPLGIPPPRTVIGVPSQAYGQGRNCRVPSASSVHCAARKRRRPGQCPPARAATGRSAACAPRPRSWAFEYRERSRCGIETTSSRRCSSGVEGTATPIELCLVGPGYCPSGPALSPAFPSALVGKPLMINRTARIGDPHFVIVANGAQIMKIGTLLTAAIVSLSAVGGGLPVNVAVTKHQQT